MRLIHVIQTVAVAAFTLFSFHPLAAQQPFGGGRGTEDAPFVIGSVSHLKDLRDRINRGEDFSGKHFKQTADLSLEAEFWVPIGTDESPFSGNYDGNGHKIRNLRIVNSKLTHLGLFGVVGNTPSKGYLKNIILESVQIVLTQHAEDYVVGALAGEIRDAYLVSHCQASLAEIRVWLPYDGGLCVGGLIGRLINGEGFVGNSVFGYAGGAKISARGSGQCLVGGLVGKIDNRGIGGQKMERCSSRIDVDLESEYAYSGAAGLVAHCQGMSLTDCYSRGDVTAQGRKFSGVLSLLVGTLRGDASNCYAVGTISSRERLQHPLLFGDAGGEFSNCYFQQYEGRLYGIEESNAQGLTKEALRQKLPEGFSQAVWKQDAEGLPTLK